MADFVAVIRRAVDGLANNTPEMRTKVYDKARGAVQRQLENMKPRPSDDMLRRQMDKLEAAIVEVESEHAEALPEAEEAVPVAVEEPVAAYPAEPEDAPHEEPAAAAEPEPEPAPEPEPEPVVYEEPVAEQHEEAAYIEPEAPAAVHEDEPQAAAHAPEELYDAPEVEPEPEPEQEPVAAAPAQDIEPQHEETAHRYGDWRDDVPPSETEEVEPVAAERGYEGYDGGRVVEENAEMRSEEAAEDVPYLSPVVSHHEPAPEAEKVENDWNWSETADANHAAKAAAAWDEVPDLPLPDSRQEILDHGPAAESVEAHFDQETSVAATSVRMPSAADLPDISVAPVAAGAVAGAAVAGAGRKEAQADAPHAEDRDPWADLEDLIGYKKDAPLTGGETENDTLSEPKVVAEAPQPAKAYRVTQERKRNYKGIALGMLGLVIVIGGAYAYWINRDSLNEMVGAFTESGPPAAETPAPETATPNTTPPPAQEQTPAQPAPAPNTNGNGAAAPTDDGSVNGTKFTQRLMPDGSEVDDGPGGVPAGGAPGQSVAQLNAPPAASAPGEPAAPETPAAPAGQGTPPAPAANPAETPALAGEKMFLYEERLGQTAPTAIEGSVAWSLQREAGADGRQEPVVQGRINVPGRGLTALITVKRNSDSSLPASHLIEIVFSVPPDFEGGAIDSVQRIAMKQTEQDRGNALIAVPAKITDDFHMIALNDFPDARNTNLELLRSRDWIDIPLAYRNGRRALLTLQKGQAGVQAFNDAIREWAALGDAANTTGQ